jgi:hypothetical protein
MFRNRGVVESIGCAGMLIHDYLADKVAEIELVIEDLESFAETPGELEALARLTEWHDRLREARDHYSRQRLLYT